MTDVAQTVEAQLNITILGQNYDLPDSIAYNAADADIKTWATEAARTGGLPGFPAQYVDFSGYMVERCPPREGRDTYLVMLRPKADFGG